MIDEYMRAALDEARHGFDEGGVPIGASLVSSGKIIATGRNRRVQDGAPTMHAEMNCLYNAGSSLYDFDNLTLYTSLMPCYMCAGAVLQFGIMKVVAAEARTANEGLRMMRQHGVEVIDLDISESRELLAEYIRANPSGWHSYPPE